MTATITDVVVRDIRFPTSRQLDGSDAVHKAPDYSAAYVVLRTDDGPEGHGLSFTLGRGTELCVGAIRSLSHLVRGRTLDSIMADMRGFSRSLTNEEQLRWLGPEKGTIHMAGGALINAVWDLYAKRDGKPLWKLLANMTPAQLVACIDFHYIADALTPEQAIDILETAAPTRPNREAELRRSGIPTYTSSAGWLGYSDDKLRSLCKQYMQQGWSRFKMKVGVDVDDDVRRAAILREQIGPDGTLMVDANQAWDVPQAIGHMRHLAPFNPLWIEEPTCADDVLGHAAIAQAVAPIGVATGEVCHNRVMFKQFFQARAMSFCQIDACRLAGVNEVIAVLLMAAKFNIPVCPHAGGVGLANYVQHLAAFNYIAVAPSLENVVVEYTDHLHEHFVDPVVIKNGKYQLPTAPGYGITMKDESLCRFEFPTGKAWAAV